MSCFILWEAFCWYGFGSTYSIIVKHHCKTITNFYSKTKYLYPDWYGLFQDDNTIIHRACGLIKTLTEWKYFGRMVFILQYNSRHLQRCIEATLVAYGGPSPCTHALYNYSFIFLVSRYLPNPIRQTQKEVQQRQSLLNIWYNCLIWYNCFMTPHPNIIFQIYLLKGFSKVSSIKSTLFKTEAK